MFRGILDNLFLPGYPFVNAIQTKVEQLMGTHACTLYYTVLLKFKIPIAGNFSSRLRTISNEPKSF